MKKKFKVLGLMFCLLIVSYSVKAQTNTFNYKTIKGQITAADAPIKDVNIIIEGTNRGTKTDSKGRYQITANVGDEINFSHVGYKIIKVVVEDVTKILNIKLSPKLNELETTTIVAGRKTGKVLEYSKSKIKTINTAIGKIDLLKYGFSNSYVNGKDLPQHCDGSPGGGNPLECAVTQKFPFIKRYTATKTSLVWDIDGSIYTTPPYMSVSLIKHIWYLSHAPAAYGSKTVVIIQTISNTSNNKKENDAVVEQYRNQDYYKEDAIAIKQDIFTTNSKQRKKNISGVVLAQNNPKQDVNIKIKGKTLGTKTNETGTYKITAQVGDILEFSHIGYYKVKIIIEDITEILNIELLAKNNKLDQVVVKAQKKKSTILKRIEKAEQPVITARGTLDPKRATYPITYIDGEEILSIYPTLTEALAGKRAGVFAATDPETLLPRIVVKPTASLNTPVFAIWDIDGQIFEQEPPMDLNNIESIHILKTLTGTAKYGSGGAGGVVVVTTKYGTFDAVQAKRKKIAEKFQNKNFYANDATIIDTSPIHTTVLKNLNSIQEAYNYYNQKLANQLKDYNSHIEIAIAFVSYYNNNTIGLEILNNVANQHSNNPEILKTIAYQLQAINAKKEAVKIYESIYKLRPNYAQSYRDLANAYVENNQFTKAWRLYMSYYLQGHNALTEGINQTVYNEMEFLYFNRKRQTQIKELFKPKSKDLLDFRNDIRIVVEWNTSEAEFDLEFVNPDKRAYVFKHSLTANQKQITIEKQQGYSSKEFFIDSVGSGEWLMNLTYLGNKKFDPTYFKVTTYYNWGKPYQHQEIRVYQLTDTHKKFQLQKINKALLIAAN